MISAYLPVAFAGLLAGFFYILRTASMIGYPLNHPKY
jgi:hypothetical protein